MESLNMHLFKVLHPQLSLETNKSLPMFYNYNLLYDPIAGLVRDRAISRTLSSQEISASWQILYKIWLSGDLSPSLDCNLVPKIWQKLQQVDTGDDEEPTGACVGGGYRWDVQLCRPGSGRQDIVEVISTIIIIIIIIIIIVTVIFIITMKRFNQNGKLSWGCSTWSVSPSSSSAPTTNKLLGFGTFAVFSRVSVSHKLVLEKVLVSVSEKLVSKKSLGFGKFGLGKKSRFRFQRIWSQKKNIGFRNFSLKKKSWLWFWKTWRSIAEEKKNGDEKGGKYKEK